jgi:uncharacterized membrane protein
MYLMRAAAWIGGTEYVPFYWTNVLLLTGFAMATATCLWMLAGRRALWFALAPTLAIYGVVNWDLAAVVLATGALFAFAARRDALAGVLIGLGASTKLYPAFLLLPLFMQGIQDREPDRSVRVLWWTIGAWVATNLPFAIFTSQGWFEFFRFNSARIPDFDSLWYIACRNVPGSCLTTPEVNVASGIGFVAIVAVVWRLKAHRNPAFPRWTLGFPILVAFLLTNKVYSPQYGLWLLPWFALVGPDLRRFVAFEVADVAVFVTRFWFFGSLVGVMEGPQQWWFEVAVLVRAVVLVWCLVGWVRVDPEPLALGNRGWRRAPAPEPEPEQAGVTAW